MMQRQASTQAAASATIAAGPTAPTIMLLRVGRERPGGQYGPYRARPVLGSTCSCEPPKASSGSARTPARKSGPRCGALLAVRFIVRLPRFVVIRGLVLKHSRV